MRGRWRWAPIPISLRGRIPKKCPRRPQLRLYIHEYDQIEHPIRKTMDLHATTNGSTSISWSSLSSADPAGELWNAAQRQMVVEGKMPVSAYWAKKIVEWTGEIALQTAIELNDQYQYDGRPEWLLGACGRFARAARWANERCSGKLGT